jgi:homogentisate 1,2-dioxygenase
MPKYMAMGELPNKKHIQFRRPDGKLYTEELFGSKGFTGMFSTLYHHHMPTEVVDWSPVPYEAPVALKDEPLHHRHLKTANVPKGGDIVADRIVMIMNQDISFALVRPNKEMDCFYKNGQGDELFFIHDGTGRLDTQFGTVPFRPGDYIVIPRGTIYRYVPDNEENRVVVFETHEQIETPKRYRNWYGQILEHAPYTERDMHGPSWMESHTETGRHKVIVKARDRMTAYFFDYHPLDVAGWDGYLYPWTFNIHDFQPITGMVHMPPPIHQTFETPSYVICSFCPRMLDYHPDSVPIPYNHSNLESDEVLYYVNSKFGSRRGIEEGSVTLHPQGIPHGPQPGAVEASLGATRTEELAVMFDTFRPLYLTEAGLKFEDPDYAFSWKPKD